MGNEPWGGMHGEQLPFVNLNTTPASALAIKLQCMLAESRVARPGGPAPPGASGSAQHECWWKGARYAPKRSISCWTLLAARPGVHKRGESSLSAAGAPRASGPLPGPWGRKGADCWTGRRRASLQAGGGLPDGRRLRTWFTASRVPPAPRLRLGGHERRMCDS